MTLTQILQKIKSVFYTKSEVDASLSGYFPKSGGQLTGGTITRDVDNSTLQFHAGSTWTRGAWLHLTGKGYDSWNGYGAFTLGAHNGTEEKQLIGYPNGTLTWNGKNIDVIEEQGDGYIRYTNGIQICWGSFKELTTDLKTITFQKPFSTVNPVISVTGQNRSNVIALDGWTSTEFYVHISSSSAASHIFLWQAIGRWK